MSRSWRLLLMLTFLALISPLEPSRGAQAAAQLTVPLRMGANQPSYQLQMTPKGHEELVALLPRLRFYSVCFNEAAARPDASATARSASLALARAELKKPQPAATSDAATRTQWSSAHTWAQMIVSALGSEADAGIGDFSCTDAVIEARNGRIANGQLAAHVRAHDSQAISAAIELHQMGVSEGDQILLSATANGEHPEVFRYLLDFPPETVRPQMLALAQHYLDQAKQMKPGSSDSNRYEVGRVPAILYFMTYGPDAQLHALLAARPLFWNDTQVLAVLAADPSQFIDYLVHAAGVDTVKSVNDLDIATYLTLPTFLGGFCPAATSLPPDKAEDFWKSAYGTIYSRIQKQHATYLGDTDRAWDTNYSTYSAGRILTQVGPCRPNAWSRERFEAHDGGNWTGFLPEEAWIPHYWKQSSYIDKISSANLPFSSALQSQFDLMTSAEFEPLFAARGPSVSAYPLNLFHAYHQVATKAGLRSFFQVHVASDEETRPYLIGKPGQPSSGCGYDTILAGIAHFRPELTGQTLKMHVWLDQTQSYFADNMYDTAASCVAGDTTLKGGQQYVINGGAALIEAVHVWKNRASVPVGPRTNESAGQFLYQSSIGASSLDGIVVEVDLNEFGDRRQLYFPLYDGDYAARLRRGAHA